MKQSGGTVGRRAFLGSLVVGGSAAVAAAQGGTAHTGGAKPRWDLSWMDELRGKHKQVFAVGALEPHQPLHIVVNYLDAHEEVFGLKYPDVNVVIGITRPAFPINASDALWKKYEIGRLWELKDPDTGAWATRNIFMDKVPAPPGKVVGVKPLLARGAIFWQCNNALNGVVRMLAAETHRPNDEIRAELVAGLNPGVRLVPAHTMALGLAQEHGCTYEQVG